MKIYSPKILALDLEGTLITTAVSMIPRPGLYDFLENCNKRFERIVMMTSVPRDWFERVRTVLIENEEVPYWFADVEYIDYSNCKYSNDGEFKDLRCIPRCRINDILIIDDVEYFIRQEQKDQCILISSYNGDKNDKEFDRIIEYMDFVF
jgi:TFIIF-interacting CTD phosphatase-like protein